MAKSKAWLLFTGMSIKHLSVWYLINPYPSKLISLKFHRLTSCLATATHNFKWVKINHICLIWDQTLANLDVNTHFIVLLTGYIAVIGNEMVFNHHDLQIVGLNDKSNKYQ